MAKVVFESSKLEKQDYTKSCKVEKVARAKMPKPLYKKLLEKSKDTAESRQTNAQALIDKLSEAFGIPAPIVRITDSGRTAVAVGGRLGEKYGYYLPVPGCITVYNLTAKKKEPVAIKTFTNTLLHEFMHHYDHVYLKLTYSRHTAGFYKRLSDLEQKLSE